MKVLGPSYSFHENFNTIQSIKMNRKKYRAAISPSSVCYMKSKDNHNYSKIKALWK